MDQYITWLMERRYIVAAAATVLLFGAIALAEPSEAEIRDAAGQCAERHGGIALAAWLTTGALGNETYENYVVFNRYRIYFGKSAVVDCTGRFRSISCRAQDAKTPDYFDVIGRAVRPAIQRASFILPFLRR